MMNDTNSLRKEFEIQKNKLFGEMLGVKAFYSINTKGCYHVLIDGHIVCNVFIDEHNNLACKIPYLIPIHYLTLFRRFFNEYLENEDSYYHRSGTGFFIDYFDKFYKYLCVAQVQQMCNIDDVDCEDLNERCFRLWLIGDTYTKKGGVLANNYYYQKLHWDNKLFER